MTDKPTDDTKQDNDTKTTQDNPPLQPAERVMDTEPLMVEAPRENPEEVTTGTTTRAEMNRTQEHGDVSDKQVSKVDVSMTESGKWRGEIEYRDKDGNRSSGEAKEFDEFSQVTAWVGGIEVDAMRDDPLQQEPVDDTTKL